MKKGGFYRPDIRVAMGEADRGGLGQNVVGPSNTKQIRVYPTLNNHHGKVGFGVGASHSQPLMEQLEQPVPCDVQFKASKLIHDGKLSKDKMQVRPCEGFRILQRDTKLNPSCHSVLELIPEISNKAEHWGTFVKHPMRPLDIAAVAGDRIDDNDANMLFGEVGNSNKDNDIVLSDAADSV